MPPRTCVILLFLSLLSAAATLGDRCHSVGGAKQRPAAKAVGSLAGQRLRVAAKKPSGRAQGQGNTQSRRPAGGPMRQRPSRRPQRRPVEQFPQTPDYVQDINSYQVAVPAPAEPRQTSAYVICYLYPAEPQVYQNTGPSQPYVATSNGAVYPPYVSYRTSLPANVRKLELGVKENKIFRPQLGDPNPSYPLNLVCPAYESVNTDAVLSPLAVDETYDNDSDYWIDTDDLDTAAEDVDPGISSLPYGGEIPLPYNSFSGSPVRVPYNTYGGEIPLPYNSFSGSPVRVPYNTYSNGIYRTPQAFRYPPPFPFRPNF